MYRISSALLPARPAASLTPADAIGASQIGFHAVETAGDFPNGLRCDRQILCIKVCHSAPHQISLLCFTLGNEGDYVIIPGNPCFTYKQVCLHTGGGNHPWTQSASFDSFRSRPSFLNPNLLETNCSAWDHSDLVNRQQCISVVLSRLLCPKSRQGQCIHSRATLLIERRGK